jgi:hypothetical protein
MQSPDGKFLISTTTSITPVIPNPPPGPKLVVPANAKTSGILDNFATWKQEKDGGTGGVVNPGDMFNKYISPSQGRQFQAKQTGKAGVRWSTHFVNDPAPTNFVYDLYVLFPDVTQQGQLELDMNHMLPNGMNCFLCTQANHNDGSWDYTTTPNGACHWNKSNIKTDPTKWTPNEWHHIRIWTSHDANGVVTYHGVEFDEVYQEFDSSCKGLSAFKEGWTPNALINNYQTNGATAAGTMNSFAKQMQVWYW